MAGNDHNIFFSNPCGWTKMYGLTDALFTVWQNRQKKHKCADLCHMRKGSGVGGVLMLETSAQSLSSKGNSDALVAMAVSV